MKKRSLAALIGVSCLVSAGLAVAGDLNPPAGPVTETLKTLVEVEPRVVMNQDNTPGDADSVFKITQSGSYYLEDNVIGADRKMGIEVAASGVTIDLNGFEVFGLVLAPAMSQSGIRVVQNGATHIVIRNGSIRAWGAAGVDASVADGVVLEDLVVSLNNTDGVVVGANATVRRVRSVQNEGDGVRAGDGSTLSEIVAHDNAGDGVEMGSYCALSSATLRENANGLLAGDDCAVRDSIAISNNVDNFQAGNAALFRGCVARLGGANGFSVKESARILDCESNQNGGDGFKVQRRSFLSGCVSDFNVSNGIEGTGGRVTALNCTASTNEMAQIALVDGDNRIEGCTASHLILVTTGIVASGRNCVVRGNHVTNNTVGYDVSGAGSTAVQNTASGCTTGYSISGGAVGNVVGSPVGAGAWDNIDL